MKPLYLIFILMILISCKKEVKNPYFASDEIYNTILKSIDNIHKDVSKTDKIFYVFNRFDTLIVISTKHENIIKPTFMIKKEGTFYYKGNKVIVTKPYHPQYDILKKDNKLKQNDIYPYLDFYSGQDYQKGLVYKIKNLNNLEFIHKGNLSNFFYKIKEYELPVIHPPKEYLGKPYKTK